MLTRRECLALAPCAAMSAFGAPSNVKGLHAGCQTNAWSMHPGNLADLTGVLKTIRALGFEGFETGFRNLENQFSQPDQARRDLRGTGLRFFGMHIFLSSYDAETSIAPFDMIIRVAQGAAALGAERLILSGAPAGINVAAKAAALNRAGEFCRSKGLRLCYHNHAPEFSGNGAEIQALLGSTDAERVHLVVDAGHALRAGANIEQFFERYHDRIDAFHLRDFRGAEQVPLGSGEFNYKPLATAIKKAKWSGWLLAEEERLSGDKPGASAAQPARETIRNVFGVT